MPAYWTQLPENRAKLARTSAKAAAHAGSHRRRAGDREIPAIRLTPKEPITMPAHWTQLPENRAKLARTSAKAAATNKKRHGHPTKHTAAARRKMSEAAKARYAHARVNGTPIAPPGAPLPAPGATLTPARVAKETLVALAVRGARERLLELDREREMLTIFIAKAAAP